MKVLAFQKTTISRCQTNFTKRIPQIRSLQTTQLLVPDLLNIALFKNRGVFPSKRQEERAATSGLKSEEDSENALWGTGFLAVMVACNLFVCCSELKANRSGESHLRGFGHTNNFRNETTLRDTIEHDKRCGYNLIKDFLHFKMMEAGHSRA